MLILRSDPALAGQGGPVTRTVPAMLPRAPARLVGREWQASTLCELLLDAGAGPVVVTGMAGVGKTALALHASHAVANHFPDGQLFVDLRGFDSLDQPLTAYDALGQLFTALGVPYDALPVSLDERSGHYRSLLAGTRTLVVLDNASAQVRPLIPGNEESAVLVTSRNRLDGLVATADGRVLSVDVLSATDGRELLSGVVGPPRAEQEPAAVELLAARCGHLPLALCIAAARLRAVPGQAIGSLVASIEPIELGVADDASVRAVFDASFRGLPDSHARAFALLGQHPGQAFTLHAAAALHGEDLPAARRLLGQLAQDHLVVECGDDRYRMHDLLAKYARQKALEMAVDREAAIRRMLDFYVAATLAADRIIHPARGLIPISLRHRGALPRFTGNHAALSWLDEHYPTLLSLMQLAEDIGSREHVWQLPYVMGSFFMARCQAEDFGASHERALRAIDQDDWRPFVAISNNLGAAYSMLGRHDEALHCFQRVLARCRQAQDVEHEARALGNLARVHEDRGDYELSIEYSEESLRLQQTLGGDRLNAATVNLASAYRRAGRHEDTRLLIKQLLRLCADRPDARTESYALRVLGQSYGDTDEVDKAVESYQRAATIAAGAGYLVQEATAQHLLGEQLLTREPTRAIPCLRRAHALYLQTGRPEAGELATLLARATAEHASATVC